MISTCKSLSRYPVKNVSRVPDVSPLYILYNVSSMAFVLHPVRFSIVLIISEFIEVIGVLRDSTIIALLMRAGTSRKVESRF